MFFIAAFALYIATLYYILLVAHLLIPTPVMLDGPDFVATFPAYATIYSLGTPANAGDSRYLRTDLTPYFKINEPKKFVKPRPKRFKKKKVPKRPKPTRLCTVDLCLHAANAGFYSPCCHPYSGFPEFPQPGKPLPEGWVKPQGKNTRLTLTLRALARRHAAPLKIITNLGEEVGFVLVPNPPASEVLTPAQLEEMIHQLTSITMDDEYEAQPTPFDDGKPLPVIQEDFSDTFFPMATRLGELFVFLILVLHGRFLFNKEQAEHFDGFFATPAFVLWHFLKTEWDEDVETVCRLCKKVSFPSHQLEVEQCFVPVPPRVYSSADLATEARSRRPNLLTLALAQSQGINGIIIPFKYTGKHVNPAKKFKWVLFKNKYSSASYCPPKAPRGPAHEVSGHLHFAPPNKHVYSAPYRYLQDGEQRGWTLVCHKKQSKKQLEVQRRANVPSSSLEPSLSMTKEEQVSFMPIHPSRYVDLKVYEDVDSPFEAALASSSNPAPSRLASDTRPAIKDENLTPVVVRTSMPASYAVAVDKDAGYAASAPEDTVSQECGEGAWPIPEKASVKLPLFPPSALPRSQVSTRPTFRQSRTYRIVAGSGFMQPIKNQPARLEDRVEVDWQLTPNPPTKQHPAQKPSRQRNQLPDPSFAPSFEDISATRYVQPHVHLPVSLKLPTNSTSSLAECSDRMRDSGKGSEGERSPLAFVEVTTRVVEEDLFLNGPTTLTVLVSLPPRDLYTHVSTRPVVCEHKTQGRATAQLSSLDLTMARLREAMRSD